MEADCWSFCSEFTFREMPRNPIIVVVGPDADSNEALLKLGTEVGTAVAQSGFTLLTGGRNRGIMDAASKGAKAAGGLTIGVLPGGDIGEMSEAVDIPILTGMGSGRNNINALSGDVMMAVGMGPGTAAEISLALKAGKPVVLLSCGEEAERFFHSLRPGLVHVVKDVQAGMTQITKLLAS